MLTSSQAARTACFQLVIAAALAAPTASAIGPYSILDLSTLGGSDSSTFGFGTLNNAGQAAGSSPLPGHPAIHAFRTAPNSPMNAAADLGTLGGDTSEARSINAPGQVVGHSKLAGDIAQLIHAFRTQPDGPITPTS